MKLLKIAVMTVAMLLLSSAGLRVSSVRSNIQKEKQTQQGWSSQNQGLLLLMKQLVRQVRRDKISQVDADRTFELAFRKGGPPDGLLRKLAQQYRSDRDYQALNKALSVHDDSVSIMSGEITMEENCRYQAAAFVWGCVIAGGEHYYCEDLANYWYCTCMQMQYDPESTLCWP